MNDIVLSGRKVLEIGRLLDANNWQTMPMAEREAFCQKHLLHHYGIKPTLVDLPGRYIRASRLKVLWDYVDHVPPGIARVRELSRFGHRLREAFERGLIKSSSSREDLDRLYEYYFGKPIAPRHPE